MNGPPTSPTAATPAAPPSALPERAALSRIDRSMKWPALLFLSSAILWLLTGTLFALITALKATSPGFIANLEWLTYGRVRSAHLNAMIYGWGNNAIFAVGLWIMARLCRAPIRHAGLLCIAGVFWNLAILIGVIGILKGDMTSVEWLEMPTYITPLIAFSYALIGVWGIIAFRFRRNRHVYVSQWYILAALFWFPWIYSIAQIMILFEPARGVVQSLVNEWFINNFLMLWLTPMGLAAAYYLIPKVLGKPIHGYCLSLPGFWALALFAGWAGAHRLTGGPVPAWIISVGAVAGVFMIVPVVVTAINHHLTVWGEGRRVVASPALCFVVFGAVSYTLAGLVGCCMAFRSINEVTHFTHFSVGHVHHGVYAFFSMIMFGGIYFMLPRLLCREWPSALLIKCHFWCVAVGISIMLLALHIGGWIQGVQLNALDENGLPVHDFLSVVKNTVPWLHVRSLSGLLITVGHIAFAINFFWMTIIRRGRSERFPVPGRKEASVS